MERKHLFLFLFVLIAVLVAAGCTTPPSDDQPANVEEIVQTLVRETQVAQAQIETVVAQTLTAMPTIEEAPEPTEVIPSLTPTDPPTEAVPPTEVPSPTPTLPPTESPTATPTVIVADAQTAPIVTVSVPTNCRTGPGRIFDFVSVLGVGVRAEVVARNANNSYWVIRNPGGSGTCWLWANYATVSGSTAGLPVWTSPPTPTPAAGTAPTPGAVTLVVSVPTNCRVGPGRAFNIVSVLPTGRRVTVVARHASLDFWVIQNPAGAGECWVWGEYATLTGPAASLPVRAAPPAATATPGVGVTPTPSTVTLVVSVPTNCRVGPARTFDIVSVLPTGRRVTVVARHAHLDYWVIQNPAGAGECWVWGEYATLSGPAASLPVRAAPPTPTPGVGVTPTPSTVTLVVSVPTNCRVGPGRTFDIISVLPTGRRVTVVARHANLDFWVIQNPAGSGECWVWGEYATLTGPAASLPVRAAPPAATPTPASVTLVVRVPTNCRVGPGRAFEIVSVLQPGRRVTVVARHASLDFWVIQNPGGAGECWLWGEYATLTGPAASLPIRTAPPAPTPRP